MIPVKVSTLWSLLALVFFAAGPSELARHLMAIPR
jgi:hypothetical protein